MIYIEDSRRSHWFTQDFDKMITELHLVRPRLMFKHFDLPHQEYVVLSGVSYPIELFIEGVQTLVFTKIEQGE